MITRPIHKTVAVMEAVAEGDYRNGWRSEQRRIGRMAAALNTATEATAKAMQEVKDAAEREKQPQAQKAEEERKPAEEENGARPKKPKRERAAAEEERRRKEEEAERERQQAAEDRKKAEVLRGQGQPICSRSSTPPPRAT